MANAPCQRKMVPGVNRVRISPSNLRPQAFAFDGQAAALVVVEQDPSRAELFLEHLIFGAEVFDELVLLVAVARRLCFLTIRGQ